MAGYQSSMLPAGRCASGALAAAAAWQKPSRRLRMRWRSGCGRLLTMSLLTRAIRGAVGKAGYDISRRALPADFDNEIVEIFGKVRSETATSPERVAAVVQAVRYVDRFKIPGALVECGVWRGGSSMALALSHSARSREVFLYDTFEGMSEPTDLDVDLNGNPASQLLAAQLPNDHSVWAVAALDIVRNNMVSTGYPQDKVQYVQGKVEDTIPATLPDQIAVLRLDTDWYQSTKHELKHLVPLVAPGGVLIIDDYGHWQGARRAVDEWLEASPRPILLNRTDYTGRIAVLP